MNYKVFERWHELSRVQDDLNELYRKKFDKVIFYGPHEWAYWECVYWSDLVTICKQTKNKLYVITGFADNGIVLPKVDCEHEFIYWPTHYISRTFVYLETLKKEKVQIENYKFHFVSFNYRARDWRCFLIDLLAKYKLIFFNAISWHDPKVVYDWKYFKPRLYQLSDTTFTKNRNYNIVPNEYHLSFAQLISETTVDYLFVSEKTATALLLEKPFLVAACKGFHKYLNDLGFVNYDEIFNYDFDNIEDTELRFESLVSNFVNLSKIPLSELKNLEEKIKPKLIHNKKIALDIVHNYDLYPEIVKEVIKDYKVNNKIHNKILLAVYNSTFNE